MKSFLTCLTRTAVIATVGLLQIHSSRAQTWLNETDLAAEADYANLQWPFALTIMAGTTPNIYGQIYEAGVTEAAGPSASINAQLGYGPVGTDPRTNPNWLWSAASFNIQAGNNDEYQGALTVNVGGTYSYTYRFSFDGGNSFTLGDLDGAGSNAGLSFSASQLGLLTVEAVPEPGVTVLLAAGVLVLLNRRRLS